MVAVTGCCLAGHVAATAIETAAAQLLLCALPPAEAGWPEQSQHLLLLLLQAIKLLRYSCHYVSGNL